MTNPVDTDIAPLPLTLAEKQEVKDRFLAENPKPAMLAMDDETAFNHTLMELKHLPPSDDAAKTMASWVAGEPQPPEVGELCGLLESARSLYLDLFPGGRSNDSALSDDTTIPTVNLQLKQVEGQEVFYMEDEETGVLHSIVFPPLLYEDAPAEVQERYNEADYRVRVQNHYNAAVSFVMKRMKCSMGLAHKIVRHLAGF